MGGRILEIENFSRTQGWDKIAVRADGEISWRRRKVRVGSGRRVERWESAVRVRAAWCSVMKSMFQVMMMNIASDENDGLVVDAGSTVCQDEVVGDQA